MDEEIKSENQKDAIDREQPVRKRESIQQTPDLFENKETMRETGINIQLKPGHYPVKHKTRRCSARTRKFDNIRTIRKDKRRGRRLFFITGGHILENDELKIP